MSLSKYFKKSASFQPENIFDIGSEENSGWHSLESEPVSLKNITITPPSQHIIKCREDCEHTSDSSQSDANLEEAESKENPPDPKKYIEVSRMERKLEKAFQTGIQNGIQKAEKEYGSAAQSLLNISQQLDSVRETIIANSSREMLEFAVTIAEKIVRGPLKNKNMVIATIEEALQRSVKSEEFYIYINPDDYNCVAEKSEDIIAGLNGLTNITIKKDAAIEKGGAKIESDNCTIDATVASQFDVIREEFNLKETDSKQTNTGKR